MLRSHRRISRSHCRRLNASRMPDEANNERWYAHYRREEAAMRVGNQTISRLSLAVLAGTDIAADAERRRRNYATLFDRLGEWAFFAEPRVSFAPMGFPVRVESAAALSERLSAARIFAARHWEDLHPIPRGLPQSIGSRDSCSRCPATIVTTRRTCIASQTP